PVLAVKGSGGDLRSIGPSGFAILYLDKLLLLVGRYRGEAHEDEMVGFYPLIAFGQNRVAASIDTPLHAFLPFPHVDHLHPDWCIALAASANGDRALEAFNKQFGRRIIWVPWQRPGFEHALTFANSEWAAELCRMGTSCPDHFLRTRICPMFVPWSPTDEADGELDALQARIEERIAAYRDDYSAYYESYATPSSPALRDT